MIFSPDSDNFRHFFFSVNLQIQVFPLLESCMYHHLCFLTLLEDDMEKEYELNDIQIEVAVIATLHDFDLGVQVIEAFDLSAAACFAKGTTYYSLPPPAAI
jgi:hypothetical protein